MDLVPLSKGPQGHSLLLQPCEIIAKRQPCRTRLLPNTKSASTLILNFLASRTVRNKFVLLLKVTWCSNSSNGPRQCWMPNIDIHFYCPSIKGLKLKAMKSMRYVSETGFWFGSLDGQCWGIQFRKAALAFLLKLHCLLSGARVQREVCLRSIILVASHGYSPSTSLSYNAFY